LCLVVENGKSKGVQIEIPLNSEVVVGRDPKTGLRIPDVMVSRQHFSVSLSGDGCFIKDMFSQNGTFVNEMRLEKETSLQVGDLIHVGETTLSLLEMEGKGLVGKEIAGYRLLERVGRGGMGTVFRANQLSLGREVAFKVLSARLTEDRKFVSLFFKEARAAGALNHPNIVQVYDVGRSQGIYYFSMEFMPCGSVEDRLNQDGKIPWAEAVKIVRDAARGLQYAQRKSVVHRDIKPDNLMIAEDATVKIADLGLAYRADESSSSPGEGILGTPHFISPEQAQGRTVDVRSDLYSLGATFFRMVTGQNAFPGRKVREIILAQIQDTARPVHELDPFIPREVSSIIQCMLEKNPDDRYQTPGELIEDLETVLGNGNGAPPAAGNPLTRMAMKIGIGAGAGILVLVVLLILLNGGDDPGDSGTQDPDPAPTPTAASGPGPAATGPGPTGPDPAAEKKAEKKALEMKAELAYMRVKSDPALTEAQRLEGFRQVAEAYPDTRFGKEARTEADGIAKKLKAEKDKKRERMQALKKAWASLQTRVKSLEEAYRFAEADGEIQKFIQTHPAVEGVDFKTEAKKLQNTLRRRARNTLDTLKEKAERLAVRDHFDEAISTLDGFLRNVAAGPSPQEVYSGLEAEASKLTAGYRKAKVDSQNRRFRADRLVLLAAYKKARGHARRYGFSEGLQVLVGAREKMLNDSYRKRFDKGIEAFTAMRDLKAAFIERSGRPKGIKGIKNTKCPLASQRLGMDTGVLKKADATHIHFTVNFKGRKIPQRFEWADYPSAKFLQLFTEDRWDMTKNEIKSVAYLAVELDRHTLAREYARRSGDKALITWVKREGNAYQLFQKALYGKVEGTWDTDQGLEVLEATRLLRQEFWDTIFFLHHTNGETPLAEEKIQ